MVSPLAQAIAFQNSVNPAQSGIAPTNVVGAYKLASDVAERNYEAKLKAQMGMWGGLASLGSAGIIGGKDIWGPALSKALAGGGTSAGAGATPLGFAPTDAELAGGITGTADAAPAAGASVAADFGTAAPAAGTIAGDVGAGTAADLGAGSIAADLGITDAAAGAADVAASTAPDWLLSLLPFLA